MKKYSRKNITITKDDVSNVFKIIEMEVLSGVKVLDVNIEGCGENTRALIKSLSSKRYHFYNELILRIKNIPYCLLKQPEGIIFFSGNKDDFKKESQCSGCKYNNLCWGYKKNEEKYFRDCIKSIPDIPREIMIEIEEKCNMDCEFCFNKNSFAEHGRSIENKLSFEYIRDIVNSAVKAGVKVIRFTGGEPLLRTDIWKLAKYVREQGCELRLNTNALLIKNFNIAKKIVDYFDNILMPIHYSDFFDQSNIAGQKIKAIYLLKKAGIKILRGGTVATKDAIVDLEQMESLIAKLGFDKWELYRVIATPKNKNSFSFENVKNLVDGLIALNEKKKKDYNIVNALPFCSYDSMKVRQVSIGAEAVDGHERFAVDPRGFAKPLYYIRENIGDPRDILACWNSDFMRKMRDLEYLPKECRDCIFRDKCRGGCRFSANIVNGEYSAPDPLMNLENKLQM